ncbi:hypothetical protein ACWDBF_21320 [Streptomyces angustmyceticus]
MTTPAMSAADIAAHEEASYVRVSPEIHRAVVRYEIAVARLDELAGMDARFLTGAQFDSLALAQDTMAESRQVLEQAGLLHLVDAGSAVAR